MRFKRSDLPGMLIAVLGPVALMFLLLQSFQLWHHHGSPILGMLSVNLAVGGGLIGGFWRFVKPTNAVIVFALALVLCVVGVLGVQAADADGTAIASLLKVGAVVSFTLLNIVVVWHILSNGLNPILARRDERAAAAEEA